MKSEHQQLLDAALAGHADEAVALLRAHYQRTARVILTGSAQPSWRLCAPTSGVARGQRRWHRGGGSLLRGAKARR